MIRKYLDTVIKYQFARYGKQLNRMFSNSDIDDTLDLIELRIKLLFELLHFDKTEFSVVDDLMLVVAENHMNDAVAEVTKAFKRLKIDSESDPSFRVTKKRSASYTEVLCKIHNIDICPYDLDFRCLITQESIVFYISPFLTGKL